MTNNTRRQHYVWGYYLDSWTVDGKLQCLRKGKERPFLTTTDSIAVMRDFYRITPITESDAKWLTAIAIDYIDNAELRKANRSWLSKMLAVSMFTQRLIDSGLATPTIRSEMDVFLNNVIEESHSWLETKCTQDIRALTQGDASFFLADEGADRFCFFLAHQFLRTKRIQDRIMQSYAGKLDPQAVERLWPALRHLFANNIYGGLYQRRKTRPLTLIRCAPGMEFITSDQPVINTHSVFASDNAAPEATEMYYPVSPKYAVILSDRSYYIELHGKALSADETNRLNHVVEVSAHEFLFARTLEALRGRRVGGHGALSRQRPTTDG